MALPVIPATTPTTVPASAAVTYGNCWVAQFTSQAQDPNGAIQVMARLRKYGTLPDGTLGFSPTDKPVQIFINDVAALAATNPDVAAAMAALVTAIQNYASAQGLL